MKPQHIRAFSLIELLVVITVLAIVAGYAVPSFWGSLQNSKALGVANEWMQACFYARSEALRQSTFVSICASANSTQTSCQSGTPNLNSWDQGWLIFLDQNGDGTLNTQQGDVILKVRDTLPTQTTLDSTQPNTLSITYSRTGYLIRGAGHYDLKPTGCVGNTSGRRIVLSSAGAPSIQMIACP